MLELDQKAFTSTFVVPALRIDAMHCNKLRKALSRVILKKPRIKDIVSDQSGNNKKLILLDSEIVANLIVDEQRAIEESQGEMVKHELTLTYSHYTADQILAAVLPKGMEITTSFETIGHIAHMNLKECHIPFRKLIGMNSTLIIHEIFSSSYCRAPLCSKNLIFFHIYFYIAILMQSILKKFETECYVLGKD